MTVTENIVYNNEIAKFGFFDKANNIKKVQELSDKYGLNVDPNAIVKDFTGGEDFDGPGDGSEWP